jgi:hypothetical protein
MTFWNDLRSTLVSAIHHPRLWIVQFVGNALILVIFALWLHIPDAHWWQLLFQFLIIVALAVGLLVLHGGTLNYFADVDKDKAAGLATPFRQALKHLPAFLIFVVIFYFILHLVGKLDDYQYQVPGYLRSEFPAFLRRLISEEGMDNFYLFCVAALRWVIVPGLLLPLGLVCAQLGFRGFASFRIWERTIRKVAYWVVMIVAALIGAYLTDKILGWTLNPDTATLGAEKTWLAFRLLVAYLLALFSWLWVCAMLGHASRPPEPPAASQRAAA